MLSEFADYSIDKIEVAKWLVFKLAVITIMLPQVTAYICPGQE